MNGPQILIVDDDAGIQRSLRRCLSEHGYVVLTVSSGEEALKVMEMQPPALVLLDLVMPGMGGMAACRAIRARSSVPIIVLSVLNDEPCKVEALQTGADDYVTKPFGTAELLARIGVALRRRAAPRSGELAVHRYEGLVIDTDRRRVTLGEREVHLTPIEYDLLRRLAVQPGRIVSHEQLLQEIWGSEDSGDLKLLRFAVFQLRKRLSDKPLHPRYIFTEPGVGYRLGISR